MPDLEQLRPGAVFHGAYEVVRCMSAGAMGAVYEVIHRETRRRRALKVMLPSLVSDPELRARFKLEATVTADVESEHIVEIFDAGVDDASQMPFLVMELLNGWDLADVLQQKGGLAPAIVVQLLRQAALALDKLHAVGIVHRDLKPENLFVIRRDDGTPRLKILDFGIAKIVAQSTQGKATQAIGTPLYMSPEQITADGPIGPAADLYALGHIAFTLLVGEGYWEPEARSHAVYALLVRIMQGAKETASQRAARRNVSLPPSFDAWFARATALDPSARFGSARELVDALRAALGLTVSADSSLRSGDFAVPDLQVEAEERTVVMPQDRPSERTVREFPAGLEPQPPPGHRTTSPFASEILGQARTARIAPERANGRAPAKLLAAGAAGAVLLVAASAVVLLRSEAPISAADATTSASAAPTPTATPTATPTPTSTPTPTPTSTATSTPTSTATPTAPAATGAAAAEGSIAAPPAAPGITPPADVAHAGRPADCAKRPFYIDARGHKIPRPACFR